MGFLSLLVVALMPVLQLLLICFIGAILSSNRINVLPPSARKDLNKVKKKGKKLKLQVIGSLLFKLFHFLDSETSISCKQIVFFVFAPALIFGSLVKTITFQEIVSW